MRAEGGLSSCADARPKARGRARRGRAAANRHAKKRLSGAPARHGLLRAPPRGAEFQEPGVRRFAALGVSTCRRRPGPQHLDRTGSAHDFPPRCPKKGPAPWCYPVETGRARARPGDSPFEGGPFSVELSASGLGAAAAAAASGQQQKGGFCERLPVAPEWVNFMAVVSRIAVREPGNPLRRC